MPVETNTTDDPTFEPPVDEAPADAAQDDADSGQADADEQADAGPTDSDADQPAEADQAAEAPALSDEQLMKLTNDDVQFIINNQGKLPAHISINAAGELVVGDKDEPAAEPEGKDEPAADDAADADDDIERLVNEFQFTDNADPDLRAAEEAKYLDMVELAEPVKKMLEYREEKLKELREKVEELENSPANDKYAAELAASLDELVSFERDQFGELTPRTGPLREYLRTNFRDQLPYLIRDHLAEPSAEHPGMTNFQAMLKTWFGANDEQIVNVGRYLLQQDRYALPEHVPAGIDGRVREAYHRSPDRERIEQAARDLIDTINNESATPEARSRAQEELRQINQNLAVIQDGIDAKNRERQEARQAPILALQKRQEQAFNETQKQAAGLLREFIDDYVKTVGEIDPAANINGLALGNVIRNALSDNDIYAQMTRDQLKNEGIRVNWELAEKHIENLQELHEKRLLQMEAKAHDRVISKTNSEIERIVRELRGMHKDFLGQVSRKQAESLSKKIAKTANDAAQRAKVPATRARPQTRTDYETTVMDFSKMEPEEVSSRVGELRAKLRAAGFQT